MTDTPQQDPQPERNRDAEPDYRFTLANERTFLAWIRTSLGLVAGGVAVHQLVPGLAPPPVRNSLAGILITLAAVLSATSYPHWRRVQLAMRRGGALPRSPLVVVLAAGVLVISVFAAVLVITE